MRKLLAIAIVGLTGFTSPALAQDGATPLDVYQLVVSAYDVVKVLGDGALEAFNNPKGEFVYKDTYVFVLKCPQYMAAHPFAIEKLKDRDLREDYPFQNSLCEGGKDASGSWVEYRWPRPGGSEPVRKIAFTIQVQGTPYTICAGIYDETTDVAELNSTLRK